MLQKPLVPAYQVYFKNIGQGFQHLWSYSVSSTQTPLPNRDLWSPVDIKSSPEVLLLPNVINAYW